MPICNAYKLYFFFSIRFIVEWFNIKTYAKTCGLTDENIKMRILKR